MPEEIHVFQLVLLCIGASFLLSVLLFRPESGSSQRKVALGLAVLIALSSVLAYPKFGRFNRLGDETHVIHYHDIWHYALGAKYYPELGYDKMYDCTAVALGELRQEGVRTPPIGEVRVLASPMEHYKLAPEMSRLKKECSQRFSPDRWDAFKADTGVWLDMPWAPRWWQTMLFDLGFNPPPTWNVIAHTFLDVVPLNKVTLELLPFIDLILILVVGSFVVGRTWGPFALTAYLLVIGTNHMASYAWTGGSYMRMVWFPLLTLALAALHTRRWRLAGVLIALSACMRVFPAVFVAGAGLAMLGMAARKDVAKRDVVEFTAAGVATGLVMLAGSLVLFDASLWADFFHKIQDHGDTYFVWHIGFKKWATWGPGVPGQDFWWGAGLRRFQGWNQMLQSTWHDGGWFFQPLRLLMVVGAAAMAWRLPPPRAAVLFGGTAMFCLTMPANYYYVWLALIPVVYFDERELNWANLARLTAFFGMLITASSVRWAYADALKQNAWWNRAMFWFFIVFLVSTALEFTPVRDRARTLARSYWKHSMAVALAALAVVSAVRTIDLDPRKNLVLILIDTIRADRLGAYGYDRNTSPRIDHHLGDQGTVFEHAYAHAPWTAPSVASMMTSMVPRDHGLVDWDMSLDTKHLTLAEHLQAEGYQTMAAISHVVFREALGFSQGFGDYDTRALKLGHPEKAVSSKVVTDVAIEQLQGRQQNKPFFLWAHYFDPHFQYLSHKGHTFPRRNPRSQRRIDKWSDTYDSEVKWTDHHVGRLLDFLDAQGLMEDSVVVLVGDHGEEFGDHGGERHSIQLFDEVVRVPFIIRAPGVNPGRVKQVVPTSDLGPTVLPLMGVDTPEGFRGAAIPVEQGSFAMSNSRPVVLETIRFADKRGWVEWPWKLIEDLEKDKITLFDLETDPRERTDLSTTEAAVREELLGKIRDHYADGRAAAPSRDLSQEELEQLEALGYMDGH